MQWIAIAAAIGWSVLHFYILFISTQCIFGIIELASEDEHKLYHKVLTSTIFGLLISLFIIPFISVGLFYYGAFNISGWHELKPALWSFASWWVALFTYSYLISVKRRT